MFYNYNLTPNFAFVTFILRKLTMIQKNKIVDEYNVIYTYIKQEVTSQYITQYKCMPIQSTQLQSTLFHIRKKRERVWSKGSH